MTMKICELNAELEKQEASNQDRLQQLTGQVQGQPLKDGAGGSSDLSELILSHPAYLKALKDVEDIQEKLTTAEIQLNSANRDISTAQKKEMILVQ